MQERDLQDYLYSHPEVLFPSGKVTEKAREYYIQGKRIDLLFVVNGIRYIVEVKNVPIEKEHIGQIVEYYGLMRHYMNDANLAMILVSSSIPVWRSTYLEELGIRCVEIPTVPTTTHERISIQKNSRTLSKRVEHKRELQSALDDGECVPFDVIAGPANPKGIAFARRMLRDSLEPIRNEFNEYEIFPFGITRAGSHDFDFEYDRDRKHGIAEFTRGGVWWAYRFGFSKDMLKNDVPNLSIIANTTGIDVTIDAELQSSQKIMLEKIQKAPSQFNKILHDHGKLWLKTYLKYEHQPRFYHWILADMKSPGEFSGEDILQIWHKHERMFNEEREQWLKFIISRNKTLSELQIQQLEARTKQLNLAIRLVEPFRESAPFWSLQPEKQVEEIIAAVQRMKPFIDFFVK